MGSPGEPRWSAAARRSPMLWRRWFDAGGGRSRFDADGACSKPSKVFSFVFYSNETRKRVNNFLEDLLAVASYRIYVE